MQEYAAAKLGQFDTVLTDAADETLCRIWLLLQPGEFDSSADVIWLNLYQVPEHCLPVLMAACMQTSKASTLCKQQPLGR